MAYVDVKTIKGNEYAYLRESIRIGKRVIHKNIKYLGAVHPKTRYIDRTVSEGRAIPTTRIRSGIEPTKEPVKKARKARFKLPKSVRQLPEGETRERAVAELIKRKKIKKKIKKIKKEKKEKEEKYADKMMSLFIPV